jgi:hypothetical protein
MRNRRLSDLKRRAVQQTIQGGMDLISKRVYQAQPSKAELRAMVPAYDEAMVKRIEPNVKGKKPTSKGK